MIILSAKNHELNAKIFVMFGAVSWMIFRKQKSATLK
jgi:hypothetical protein